MASPMPLLAPVTMATFPSSSRSIDGHSPWSDEPGEDGVGDVAPAVVDGQRVPAPLELLELGDRRGVPVLLEGRPGDHVGHGVVLRSGDEQQRPAVGVLGVDLGLGVHVEVRGGRLEQRPGRRRDRPPFVQRVGLLLAHRVAETEAELLARQGDGPVPVGRVAQRREAGPQLRQRQRQDALDLGGVDRDGRRTDALPEQLLGDAARRTSGR